METNRQKTKVFNIHLGRENAGLYVLIGAQTDWFLNYFSCFQTRSCHVTQGSFGFTMFLLRGGIRVTYHAAWLLQLSHHTTPTYLLQSRFLQRTQRRENILQELDKTISNYTITLVFTKVTGCLNSGEACSTVYQKLELQFGFENLILN